MNELTLRPILQTHGTEESYYTNPVCTATDWWVTSAIDVIFVMLLIVVALWIIKQCLGIYNALFRREKIVKSI